MCGIAGIVRFDGRPANRDDLLAMSATLTHRGPDGDGVWAAGPVGFSHTRLSIIDLAGSPQPMASSDGRLHVCFNGEIFNYQQLRNSIHYPYATHGDTETLLALFDREGPQGVTRAVGQFAYAIHDARTGEVYLFRDRLGILPLYYVIDDDRLAFASEIKALRPVLQGEPGVDRSQLPKFLMRRAVPAPHTLVAGVRKVPPGHYLRIGPDGRTELIRYWQLPEPSELLDLDPTAAVDLVEQHLDQAVQAALVADVPIGSYLSGGVDSSLIVALASKYVPSGTLNTFAASFGDERYDETSYAEQVASLHSCIHHRVDVRAEDFVDLWPVLTRHRDAPLSEPADVAVFRLAQAARQEVKIVLSGEGSDELFGGYPKYKLAGLSARPFAPGRALQLLRLGERIMPARAERMRIAMRALAGRTSEERIASWFAPFTGYEVAQLLGVPMREAYEVIEHRDGIDLMSRTDIGGWLPDNLLERGDRMSMAASLELRPPFMDHRLVETAFRLPSSVKVRDGQTKWVLKQVAARYLPDSIVHRRKVGFRVPLDAWFRGGLRDMSRDLLLGEDSFASATFDPRFIADLLQSHETGRRNEAIRIWTLLSLEVWVREYLGRAGVLTG